MELLECCNGFSFAGIFNVHVPSQVRLAITAHFELHHLTVLFKLWQHIFIKFPETKNCPVPNYTANYTTSVFNTV
jgi:hypothetical protein